MKNEEIKEFHEFLENYCRSKNFRVPQILAFLSSCLVGTMFMHGYSQEFFDATCERMKKNFREKSQ